MSKPLFLFYFACCILLFAGFQNIQKATPIILHDQKMAYTVHEFYIADVLDKRSDRTSVASLITINQAHLPATQPVNLQGGVTTAIKQFIDRNLHRDTKLRPVIITIKAFKLT